MYRNDEEDLHKGAVLTIASLVVAVVLCSALGVYIFAYDSVMGIFREDVRRTTFEHSKAYREGKAQDLNKYYLEWRRADADGRKAIESVVRHEYADFKDDSLNSNLSEFIRHCMEGN